MFNFTGKGSIMRLYIAEIARRNKGWNMRKLADRLDLDHQTVLYWNQGRTYPRLPTLVKLCRLLECTLEDLLGENGGI
jgi:DNA-binding Xre family transcriptional regulator